MSSSHSDAGELGAALRAMRGRIDGLIVMAPDPAVRSGLEAGASSVPRVLVDPGIGTQGCDTLTIAHYEGAYQAVRHLLALGHRRVAMITGPERNLDARQRLEGFRAALRNGGGDLSPDLEIRGDFTERSGHDAASPLLAIVPRATAVFSGNDAMAGGLMSALAGAGVRVPADLAVVGFDDIALARYLSPPLTTVHVDAFRLGERAMQMMLNLLAQRGRTTERVHEVIGTRLVVRGSCGAPPPAGHPGGARPPVA